MARPRPDMGDRMTVRLTGDEVQAALTRYNSDAGLPADSGLNPMAAYRAVLREAARRQGTVPARCSAVVCWRPMTYRWHKRAAGYPGAMVRLRIRYEPLFAGSRPSAAGPPAGPWRS